MFQNPSVPKKIHIEFGASYFMGYVLVEFS
jgi:hypothetical protein